MQLATIPMTSDVQQRLPGVKVLGAQFALNPRPDLPALTREADWRRLHAIWRGKSKATIAADPFIAAYIRFYEQIGLNPKQTPPSVQNLIQRFLNRDTLERFPIIHPIVDAVNVAAVETLIALGVFDAHCVDGTLALALTEGTERFQPLGGEPLVLPADLLVLRDQHKVLSQFGYRDSEVQKVTPATRSIWLLGCQVPGVPEDSVIQALARALELIDRGYEVSPAPDTVTR